MSDYVVGQGGSRTLPILVTDAGGAPVTPDSLDLYISDPSEVEQVHAELADFDLISIGRYDYVWVVPVDAEVGEWTARWDGIISGTDAIDVVLTVRVTLPGELSVPTTCDRVYATVEDLAARLSAAYAVPDQADRILCRASEVIDEATLGRAAFAWDADEDNSLGYRSTLRNATCDQVEFWLEAGEEHDVASLRGSVVSGRLQLHPTGPKLGDRARRTLLNGGLFYRGVGSR